MTRGGFAILLAGVLLCLAAVACAPREHLSHGGGASAAAGPLDTTAPPDHRLVSDDGVWELHIWYRAKGTRSEGQHGALFRDGREVRPPEIGAEYETGLGLMRYYGQPQGAVPWLPTGWNFADPAKELRPSWEG